MITKSDEELQLRAEQKILQRHVITVLSSSMLISILLLLFAYYKHSVSVAVVLVCIAPMFFYMLSNIKYFTKLHKVNIKLKQIELR